MSAEQAVLAMAKVAGENERALGFLEALVYLGRVAKESTVEEKAVKA